MSITEERGTGADMGAKVSRPLESAHGWPELRASDWMSLAVISLNTATMDM